MMKFLLVVGLCTTIVSSQSPASGIKSKLGAALMSFLGKDMDSEASGIGPQYKPPRNPEKDFNKNMRILDSQTHRDAAGALIYAQGKLPTPEQDPRVVPFLDHLSRIGRAEGDQGKTILSGDGLLEIFKSYDSNALHSYFGMLDVYAGILNGDKRLLKEFKTYAPHHPPVAGDGFTLATASTIYLIHNKKFQEHNRTKGLETEEDQKDEAALVAAKLVRMGCLTGSPLDVDIKATAQSAN